MGEIGSALGGTIALYGFQRRADARGINGGRGVMVITFEFLAQARTAAMRNQASAQFDTAIDLPAALREIGRQQGDALQRLMFDQRGELRASLLVMVNGQLVSATDAHVLRDGDTITLLTPIGGG